LQTIVETKLANHNTLPLKFGRPFFVLLVKSLSLNLKNLRSHKIKISF